MADDSLQRSIEHLLTCAEHWRLCQKMHAMIVLGELEGDKKKADRNRMIAERDLMVATDEYIRKVGRN